MPRPVKSSQPKKKIPAKKGTKKENIEKNERLESNTPVESPKELFGAGARRRSRYEEDLNLIFEKSCDLRMEFQELDSNVDRALDRASDLSMNSDALLRARNAANVVMYAIKWKKKALGSNTPPANDPTESEDSSDSIGSSYPDDVAVGEEGCIPPQLPTPLRRH